MANRAVAMTGFRRFIQSRLEAQQQQFTAHPDASLLSAFAEQRLAGTEQAGVVSHLAQCHECREILLLLGTADDLAVIPAHPPRPRTFWRAPIRQWRWA